MNFDINLQSKADLRKICQSSTQSRSAKEQLLKLATVQLSDASLEAQPQAVLSST